MSKMFLQSSKLTYWKPLLRFFLAGFVLITGSAIQAADCLDVFSQGLQTSTPRLILPPFLTSSSSTDRSGTNLNLTAGQYDDVTVGQNGSVTFSTTDGEYRMDSLELGQNAQAYFAPGDYYIDDLDLDQGADIILTGSGTVRIYTNSFTGDRNINVAINSTYLVMTVYGSMSVDRNFDLDGALHVSGAMVIGRNSNIRGSINVAGAYSLGTNTTTTYDTDYINNADFNGMCEGGAGGTTPASLMLHWEFSEGSGQTVADSSGNGRTGTLGSSSGSDGADPTWVCTSTGYAMEFDSSINSRITASSFTPPSEGAVAFWYKIPAEVTTTERIFGFSSSWELRVSSDDVFNLDMNTPDDTDMTSSGPMTTTDTWIHIAINVNASTNEWAIYVNGVLDNSGTDSQSAQSAAVFTLGGSTWTSDYWTGTIADFRIYDGNLTPAEITTLAGTAPVDCATPPPPTQVCEDFESGLGDWTLNGAGWGNAGTTSLTYNSPSNSYYSRGGTVQATWSPVDTSGFTTLELSIWVRRGDDSFSENPESGEDLVLSYLNDSGSWVVLETFDGGGTPGQIYDRTYTLPASAIHNNFQVRLLQTDGDSYWWDFWHVDDVCVGGATTPSSLHHIEITTDGDALTCTDETVTIRACLDAACTSVATEDISVTLGTTGSASWDSNPITIPANSNAGVTATLTNRTAETVTMSVTSTSVAATDPLVCSNGSCQVTFNEAGYILSLPNHNSCLASTLSIQAVRLSDNGFSCAPAFTGNQSVNFEFNYSNPVSGTTIPDLASTPMAAAGVTQSRTINFDANAQANLDFSYDDAGLVTVTVSDGGSNGLSSSNVNTIVTPSQLLVYATDANNSCTGPDYGNCSEFRTAGVTGNASSEFNLVVAGACADNTVTPNFQLNNIALTPNLVAPATGNTGSLGVTSVDVSSGGTVTATQTYSEVGAMSVTATPPAYQGQTIPATTSSTIGRFTPHRFLVSDNNPMLDDATCNFTYQDQETVFATGLEPQITITAVNSAGTTTTNYGGDGIANNDFWKFNSADYSGRLYSNQATPYPGTVSATLNATTIAGHTNYDGVHTITFDNDGITHNKTGVVPQTTNDAPFNAEVLLTLTAASLTDTDGIFYDSDVNGLADIYNSSTIGGTNVRWGRWNLENGYGSELQAMTMNATAEYFDGNQFVTSTADSCTPAVTLNLSNFSGNLSSGETTASQTAITSGVIPISLTAPGLNNIGSVLITITTPSWLQYDYDGDGSLEDAQATATFGIYEGRRPVIIKRQTY